MKDFVTKDVATRTKEKFVSNSKIYNESILSFVINKLNKFEFIFAKMQNCLTI